MRTIPRSSLIIVSFVALSAATFYSAAHGSAESPSHTAASKGPIPLKEAKLNIEHNATDRDTGFQGAIDSEGWRRLDMRGPDGRVLKLEGRGSLAKLGLTELFFETVEPENADVPIKRMLAKLPEGKYQIAGPAQENGKRMGRTEGKAWLTHDIPQGPQLLSPAEGATVPGEGGCGQLGARVQDDHGQAGEDHLLPADHREGRRPAPPHDRRVRAEHVPAAVGDEHRRPGRGP